MSSDSPAPSAPVRWIRFPLSAKILVWFFVNLAFLGIVGWIFVRAQFRLGLDSLLAGPANERLQAMAEVVVVQLNERPPANWPAVLQSSADAYRVQVALYRNDGSRLAGEIAEPPAAVIERITAPRKALLQGGSRESRRDSPSPGNPPPEPPPSGMPLPSNGFPKSILHTTQPALYWVLIRVPVPDRQNHQPMRCTLIVATPSLSGNGLLFDVKPWIIGAAVVLAVSVLLWLPLVRGITRALRQMTGTAEAIAQGRFDTTVHTTRADELGRLATALNHMAGRLREFFTGQKRFLGDIAHELCSPLARMEMALSILDQRADETQHSYVADVREELRQMSSLVNELLSFSKAGVGGKNVELKPVALAELAYRVVARETQDSGEVVVDISGGLTALAEPDLLARALGNVVRNARRYANPSPADGGKDGPQKYSYRPVRSNKGGVTGPITVSAVESGPDVVISVEDCGPGVPEEALHRLFDPFFRPEAARTRETGGTGLGLAIVKSCIEACGGSVSVKNRQPNGLQVDFTLRRAQRS